MASVSIFTIAMVYEDVSPEVIHGLGQRPIDHLEQPKLIHGLSFGRVLSQLTDPWMMRICSNCTLISAMAKLCVAMWTLSHLKDATEGLF